jgi:hypothetical protein
MLPFPGLKADLSLRMAPLCCATQSPVACVRWVGHSILRVGARGCSCAGWGVVVDASRMLQPNQMRAGGLFAPGLSFASYNLYYPCSGQWQPELSRKGAGAPKLRGQQHAHFRDFPSESCQSCQGRTTAA